MINYEDHDNICLGNCHYPYRRNPDGDRTGPFASYMTRSSYGIYIVHYLVIVTIGYLLKVKTQMSPVYIYLILTIAVFTLSPLIYEVIRRIPFIRWCVLGEKK